MSTTKLKGLRAWTRSLEREIADELAAGGEDIRSTAAGSIERGSKTGRVYKRRSIVHQASAPGEAPAQDEGRLSSHITNPPLLNRRGRLVQYVGIMDTVNVVYAARLEFGGWDKRRVYVAPRPYLTPAFMEHKGDILKNLKAAVKRASARR